NKIHPDRKLCMFETQRRGRCNDDQCLSQHFRDLPLNDHELVQDLLSYYEGCTDEQKIEYREGLKSLYDKMKEEKWDVNTCIDAMIDYRTEFNARHRSDYLDPLKHVPRRIVFNKKRPLSDPLDCEDDRASTSEEEYSSESLPTPEIITTMDDQEGYTPFEQSSPEYGMEYEEQINYLDPVSVEPHEHIFPEYDDNSEAEKDDPGKFDVPPSPSEHDSDVGEDEAYEELQQGSEESHVEQPQEVTALENKQENTPSNSEPQETPQPSSGFN
ncbi:10952_t:CDS:2, partial [Acaulospora morrowiae]